MRVLVWQWGRFGGGPRYALELAAALRTHCGVETRLSLAEGAEILQSESLRSANDWPVVTAQKPLALARDAPRIWRRLAALSRELKTCRPDAAICTMAGYWDGFLLRMLRREGVPFAAMIHDATLHPGDTIPLVDFMQRRQLTACKTVITLTDYVAARLRDRDFLGLVPQITIPHASFDFPELRLSPPQPIRYPGDGPLRILLAGRLKAYKGLELLQAALDRLPADRVQVRIAGAADDPDIVAPFRRRPNVEFALGWLNDAQFIEHVDWSDVLVLPYTEASQSGVVPVAFKRGRTVVTTGVGGLPEQVTAGVNGLIASEVSGAALAEEINRFAGDPDLLRSCCAGALETATGAWSWRAIAPRFMDVLSGIAADR